MEHLTSFLAGVLFTTFVTFQHTNSAYGRWKLAFFTSLCVACCVWFQIQALVRGDVKTFFIFQIGSAFGSSLGILFGHKIQEIIGGKK